MKNLIRFLTAFLLLFVLSFASSSAENSQLKTDYDMISVYDVPILSIEILNLPVIGILQLEDKDEGTVYVLICHYLKLDNNINLDYKTIIQLRNYKISIKERQSDLCRFTNSNILPI